MHRGLIKITFANYYYNNIILNFETYKNKIDFRNNKCTVTETYENNY